MKEILQIKMESAGRESKKKCRKYIALHVFFTGLASCTIEQNGRKNAIDMVQKGCLKDKELRMDDIMFGLTEKIFGVDYYIVKTSIYRELKGLAR